MEVVKAKNADSDAFWEKSLSIYAKKLELIASNIANADTPNYKARDVDFKAALNQAMMSPEAPVQKGQQSKLALQNDLFPVMYRVPAQPSADNNTVDMDMERAEFADTAIRYEMAVKKVSGEYKEMSELLKSLPY
mgnify:CR=1 FL=1